MTQTHFTFADGRRVNRIGFGAMRLTGQPGNFGPYEDWDAGVALLRQAADMGVDFFDSARSYGPLHADRIVGEALEGREVFIATKGGVDKPEPGRITIDGSRDTLLREVDEALINLRRDQIDLFQLHRVDPNTPIEESIAALAEAQADGRIANIGLSNVRREDVRRALTVAPIASIQNRFNSAESHDDGLVDFAAERGIAFIPYGPLGASPMARGARLNPVTALNWLMQRSPNIVAIPGTTSSLHLSQNVSALAA